MPTEDAGVNVKVLAAAQSGATYRARLEAASKRTPRLKGERGDSRMDPEAEAEVIGPGLELDPSQSEVVGAVTGEVTSKEPRSPAEREEATSPGVAEG